MEASFDQPRQPMNRQLAQLNRKFKDALRNNWRMLNLGLPRTRGPQGRSTLQSYVGRHLSWRELASMVAVELEQTQISRSWSVEDVKKVLEKLDLNPPNDQLDRQIFLETVEQVLESCLEKRLEAASGPLMKNSDGQVSALDDKNGVRLIWQTKFLRFLGWPTTSAGLRTLNFDARSVGFFEITTWNYNRYLSPDFVSLPTEVIDRAPQDWFDREALAAYQDQAYAEDPGSPCPTLSSYIIDHRESGSDTLRLTVSQSQYYRHVAVARMMRENTAAYDRLVQRVGSADSPDGGLSRVIAGAPDSNIVINVTVMDRDGDVLLLQRHQSARVWPGVFQFGLHETMNWPTSGSVQETCFKLAERALFEECGIRDPAEYLDKIVFSWFGYYLPEASTYFFAHVKTKLTKNRLANLIDRAHSRFEFDDVNWISPTSVNVRDILSAWPNGPWQASTDSVGRRFLPHSTVSFTQLYRVLRHGML